MDQWVNDDSYFFGRSVTGSAFVALYVQDPNLVIIVPAEPHSEPLVLNSPKDPHK